MHGIMHYLIKELSRPNMQLPNPVYLSLNVALDWYLHYGFQTIKRIFVGAIYTASGYSVLFTTTPAPRINTRNAIPQFGLFSTCREKKSIRSFAQYVHVYTREHRLSMITATYLGKMSVKAQTRISVYLSHASNVTNPFSPLP
jgi:hypothetical protein